MIMNDEPRCVEDEPRFKINQNVYFYDDEKSKVISGIITNIDFSKVLPEYIYRCRASENKTMKMLLPSGSYRYAVVPDNYYIRENQIFTDFDSCKVSAHATYLQKIKELLEQKDD